MDYENDILIDESSLDVECLHQASLMMKYTKHKAEAERNRDKAKDYLSLIKSELDLKIRSNPENFKLEKVTEASITAAILQQETYKEANEDYLNKSFDFNVSAGVVQSMDQRKRMLELLVQLHGQNYFAGPNIPRDLSYEANRVAKQKESDAGVASKLKRKPKF